MHLLPTLLVLFTLNTTTGVSNTMSTGSTSYYDPLTGKTNTMTTYGVQGSGVTTSGAIAGLKGMDGGAVYDQPAGTTTTYGNTLPAFSIGDQGQYGNYNNYSSGGGGGYSEPAPTTYQDSYGNTYSSQADANASNDFIASLNDQEGQLKGLLGRTETGLNQGLSKLNDDFNEQNNNVGTQRAQARQNFGEQRVDTTKGKQSTYDTINSKSNRGYRSLAQIIGRAGGTGSSAFQEALPDAIGKEISGDRTIANETYGQNMGRIGKAEGETELSFENILKDLARQRQSGEADLRTGIESQRQGINSQMAQVAAQRAQAQGGGYAQAKAAAAPFQGAIENSRNSVEGFFNQFKPTIQAQQAAIARPELGQYSVDRADINAQQSGGGEGGNPYADMLRKKLRDGGVA